MKLGELCAAAIDWSDNTAANLILPASAGRRDSPISPVRSATRKPGSTAMSRPSTRPIPGDERDTTSPSPWRETSRQVLLGNVLSAASRSQLEAWLIADKVGDKRLRAGLPPTWGIGDKTGSGDHGTANTIGIIRPPGRAPLLAAVYYTEPTPRWTRATPSISRSGRSLRRRSDALTVIA